MRFYSLIMNLKSEMNLIIVLVQDIFVKVQQNRYFWHTFWNSVASPVQPTCVILETFYSHHKTHLCRH